MPPFTNRLRLWLHDLAFERRRLLRARREPAPLPAFDFHGKHAAVFGVATDQSIAWSIAQALDAHGCRLALGFQERAAPYVQKLSSELHNPLCRVCELQHDGQIGEFFEQIGAVFPRIDILVHSVAFAKKEFLDGPYLRVDRKGFLTAQEVSVYSLTALVKAAEPLLAPGGRVMTMTYLGSERAVPNYNVMGVAKAALESSVRYLAADLGPRGITVNAISAGPLKTLAASGIAGFDRSMAMMEERSPLRRNISADDAAHLALFLASDLARNITGQVIFVDAGFNIV